MAIQDSGEHHLVNQFLHLHWSHRKTSAGHGVDSQMFLALGGAEAVTPLAACYVEALLVPIVHLKVLLKLK